MATQEQAKLLEKLKRIQELHERAETPGEREAAARAICRLVSKILHLSSTGPQVREFVYPNFAD